MPHPSKRKILPRHVDPRKLVVQGATLTGDTPAAELTRLRDAVLSTEGDVETSLVFSRDETGNPQVEGRLSLEVRLECQRCMQPMRFELRTGSRLGIVWNEQRAKQLPKELEPWVVESEEADLFALVEEELLLALPIAAYHEEAECEGKGFYSSPAPDDNSDEESQSPFSVLAKLKRRD